MTTLKAKRLSAIEDAKINLLHEYSFKCNLTDESYQRIANHVQKRTYPLAFAVAQLCLDFQPLTLRGLHYQVVSAGVYENTQNNYKCLSRLMVRLREDGLIPFEWIVDNLRDTDKPSSWSNLTDCLRTVQDTYRMDFWARLPDYVCVIVEKDAVAGMLKSVTRRYDVALQVIRGFVSLSFVHGIAKDWKAIDKPIYAYYMGDHDPSGRDIERDVRKKLIRYSGRDDVYWKRLAITPEQMSQFGIIPLPVKAKDSRAGPFVEKYGARGAELDALRPDIMRGLLTDAIESHIPKDKWARLMEIEAAEKESFQAVFSGLPLHTETGLDPLLTPKGAER